MKKKEMDKEIRRAVRPYTAPVLLFYDTGVYKIWNPFIWKCPSICLEKHFKRNVSAIHLEAGCGTGYLPYHCLAASIQTSKNANKKQQLTLLDYSPGSLKWAARRLSRYRPDIIRHNLFLPLTQFNHPFESICLNYVLHCLPGSFTEKEKVVGNLKKVMSPKGVLFGSTILGSGITQSPSARLILALYNLIGSFHNMHDTRDGLKAALLNNFKYADISVIGSVALFAASDIQIQPAV